MNTAGFTFYLDGKRISASNLKLEFKDVVSPVVVLKEVTKKQKEEKNVEESSKLKYNTTPDFPITSRTIVCTTTGKMYKTQKDAGEDLGIDPSWISYCISKNKTHKGYAFAKAVDVI